MALSGSKKSQVPTKKFASLYICLMHFINQAGLVLQMSGKLLRSDLA